MIMSSLEHNNSLLKIVNDLHQEQIEMEFLIQKVLETAGEIDALQFNNSEVFSEYLRKYSVDAKTLVECIKMVAEELHKINELYETTEWDCSDLIISRLKEDGTI